jgi:hypothetical protein
MDVCRGILMTRNTSRIPICARRRKSAAMTRARAAAAKNIRNAVARLMLLPRTEGPSASWSGLTEPDPDKVNQAAPARAALGQHNRDTQWKAFAWESVERVHARGNFGDLRCGGSAANAALVADKICATARSSVPLIPFVPRQADET